MSQAERYEREPDEDGAAAPPSTRLPDRPPLPDFWMGALIGCVLQGLIWMTASLLMDDPVRPVDRPGETELRDAPSANGDQPHDATRLPQCPSVAEAMAGPLHPARPAPEPWKVHGGTMNEVVVGAVTPQPPDLRTAQGPSRAAGREAGCQETDPTGWAFVRPRPASSVQAAASAGPGERQRAGRAADDTSAGASASGHRPAAAGDPGDVAALPPAALHPVDGTAPPAAAPPAAAPPSATPPTAPPSGTPPTSGEPGPSAPPASPPTEPTGGTPTPAPVTGTPSADPTYPGQSGPHRQDQDPGRPPAPIGHPAPGPGPLPDTAAGAPDAPGPRAP